MMKVAIIGSRSLIIENLGKYIPDGITEIVSGGASGVDKCAEKYAAETGISLTVFLPEYSKYGRAAPIIRNKQIIEYSDCVVALWDGVSRGTKNIIDECMKVNKKVDVYLIKIPQ